MTATAEPDAQVDRQATLISHLTELRSRLLRIVAAVVVVFLVLSPFAQNIFAFVAGPLIAQMPAGSSMIATRVVAPFLTPFKLTLLVAVFIAMPYLLYQVWAFVAPGLYQKEKRLVFPLMATSVFLFYLGAAFAYFVVFPLVFGFMQAVAPAGVAVTPDITEYLDFVMVMFFAFGMAFEVPVATVLLVWTGFTTPKKLGTKRPYVLLAAFVGGMLLTPPDIISQTLLAIPVYALFEIGIIMSRVLVPAKVEMEVPNDDPVS
ncbi:MAG: twin-arginine translocase subunit TatC [Gammaproteobacteria bacterium]|nr:twin-arginine translocase subunit TatC [Gammaproteobacteria bacterium]NND59333.1 twin-arginine translocase subunit TatC [Gammaproteobacteria bacterium]